MEKSGSISSKYKFLQSELSKLKSSLDFTEFQKIHKQFIELLTLIDDADIYSDNETLDEVDTSSLVYLLVQYEHGKFVDANAVRSQLGPDAEAMKRNRLRLVVLQIVESIIWKFVSLVVLDLKLFEYAKNGTHSDDVFKNIYKWINVYSDIRQREISNNGVRGFVKLNELEQINFKGSGPMGRRDLKIGKWKLEKELNEKVKIIDDNDDLGILDDEIVRKVRIDQILLAVIDSMGILENTSMERELLGNAAGDDSINQLNFEGIKLTEVENEGTDSRKEKNKVSRFDKGYTDKVESLASNNQILSKEGKVLRPFTIVSSDQQRKQLQNKVMGTGQYLPTMTVEELVDQELANGGMVKPQEEEPEVDEDDYKWQDKETYRLRDWDEFTDANKKGSGNKMGNLG